MLRPLVLLLAASLCSCAHAPVTDSRSPAPPRLLYVDKERGVLRLWAQAPGAPAPERVLEAVPGLLGARASRSGEWLVVQVGLDDSSSELRRFGSTALSGEGEPIGRFPFASPSALREVSADGRAALVHEKKAGEEGLWLISAGRPARELMRFRQAWQSAISDDGTVAYLSGMPKSCVAPVPMGCPIELWRLRLDQPDAPAQRIAAEARCAYLPALSGGALFFQRTIDEDQGCLKNLNACEHAVFREVPGAAPQVVERRAVGPAPSPTGRRIAFLKYPDECRSIPCQEYRLLVRDEAGRDSSLGNAAVVFEHFWSPDEQRLAFMQRNGRDWDMFVVPTAGGDAKALGGGWIIGWLSH